MPGKAPLATPTLSPRLAAAAAHAQCRSSKAAILSYYLIFSHTLPYFPTKAAIYPTARVCGVRRHEPPHKLSHQLAAMHPIPPKPSQYFPILPTKAAINRTARLPRRSVTKPGVCGEMWHTIYCRGANTCLPRDRIGKYWEVLGSIGKRAKPAAAGRRSAPASYTLGKALCIHTLSPRLAAAAAHAQCCSSKAAMPVRPVRPVRPVGQPPRTMPLRLAAR